MKQIFRILTCATLVLSGLSGTSRAEECDSSSFAGNGTLPKLWYGYLVNQDATAWNRVQLNLRRRSELTYQPSALSCDMSDTLGFGYVVTGTLSIATDPIMRFAVNSICISNDKQNAELVGTDVSRRVLHLPGQVRQGQDGLEFLGWSINGARFVLVEDRRNDTCP